MLNTEENTEKGTDGKMASKELVYKDDVRRAILKANPSIAFCIDNIKAVDAKEVVHGRWHKPTPYSQEFCTNCGLTPKTNFGWLPPYCPHCGADMRGKEDGK